jgi:hypothetical protein
MSREHPTVFQSQDRVPGTPGNHALGFWLTYRKMATAAYVPGQKSRMALIGRQPFWYNLGFPNTTFAPMTPNENEDDRITVINDFILLAILGSAVDTTGAINSDFAIQLIDSGKGERWQEVLMNATNICGTARHPFYLRRPHKVNAGSPIICRFQNFHPTNNNMPQVTLFGVLGAPHE